ncbi:MAG: ABC transporter ATP-binding protein [Bacteroidia bacterium]|nr:ABC transporter ATP-binding protein [Bacteroidia bacterium]
MLRLLPLVRPYARLGITASIYSILNKVLDLMPPLLVGWIIDNLTGHPPGWISGWLRITDVWQGAIFLSALIILIFGFESLFEWLYSLTFKRMAQHVQHDLRLKTYDHLQHLETAFFEKNRTGNLMSIVNDDINRLETFLNSGFNDLLQLGVLCVFASVSLTLYSPGLALIGMATIPVIIAGSIWYQRRISPYYQRIRSAVGELNNRLENNLSGIMVIKSFSAEGFELSRVAETSDAYRQANLDAIRWNALFIPMIRMVIALGFAGCMLLGSWWVVQETGLITAGGLTFFGMMIQRLLWPMTRMGQILDEYERARASARRVLGLLDTPRQAPPVADAVPDTRRATGEINLEGVSFSYLPGVAVLPPLDLHIRAGDTIGIAGPSGAGKTTLIKLLLRMYDPTAGRITLDGTDLRSLDLAWLRNQIALVSQDTYLFHGSLAENIAYGLPDCPIERIEAAARQAELHTFISGLPQGYDTQVGERGIRLSGGQRQRISIARAILRDAPVLILDEATSAVDSETERAIQEHLDQIVAGRTAIIIAHRLSTLRHADRILVLQHGQIAESGTHDALLALDGLYADLWRVQTGERLADNLSR